MQNSWKSFQVFKDVSVWTSWDLSLRYQSAKTLNCQRSSVPVWLGMNLVFNKQMRISIQRFWHPSIRALRHVLIPGWKIEIKVNILINLRINPENQLWLLTTAVYMICKRNPQHWVSISLCSCFVHVQK